MRRILTLLAVLLVGVGISLVPSPAHAGQWDCNPFHVNYDLKRVLRTCMDGPDGSLKYQVRIYVCDPPQCFWRDGQCRWYRVIGGEEPSWVYWYYGETLEDWKVRTC